jgi:hypothetical protein
MGVRSDREKLHHKPRHSELVSLQHLATVAARPPELAGTELLGERLKRWGVQSDDPSVIAVRKQLARIQLSIEDQFWMFETAERIAAAEKAKAAWNPKAKAAQNLRLCKVVTAAARLIQEISAVFPPPWTEQRARLGLLVAEMAAFLEGTLAATMVVNKNAAVSLASATVRTMKQQRSPKGRVYWELLQDLVWLASGKTAGRISERSVRRYLEDQRMAESSARAYWRRHFELIQAAVRLTPLQDPAPPKGDDGPGGGKTRPVDGADLRGQPNAIEAFREMVKLYGI